MILIRYFGFVIGQDATRHGHSIWKVRVDDLRSPHHKKKLIVASTQENVQLSRGLDVDFVIGSLSNDVGGKNLRAVDVRVIVRE